jgi:transcription elongation factor GreA
LPKEIKRALEFGDLRENSEYRAALDRQNVVKARIVELRQRISEIASIDPNKVPRDKASYGSTLVLYDGEKDEEVTYRLVTPEESDPAQGLISTRRPSAQFDGQTGRRRGDGAYAGRRPHSRSGSCVRCTTNWSGQIRKA